MEENMEKITTDQAFEMGFEACLKGYPWNPLFNECFWEKANKIDQHSAWKSIVNAYQEGWNQANKKKHLVGPYEC